MIAEPPVAQVQFRIRGIVQGVGFRPFVHRTGIALGLKGWVLNDAEGVLARVCGPDSRIDDFEHALRHHAPPAACIETIHRVAIDDEPGDYDSFVIRQSRSGQGAATARASIPADLALCGDCRRELADPSNRRHAYPFTNCTQCGPRYSIIESLPYDRERTTMHRFRMCAACRNEYDNPSDRRHHAEPNACPHCGPQVVLYDASGNRIARAAAALPAVAEALRRGEIVAVKGIGGFHLMCDASSERAVARLRARKHREEKPLAVMFPDLASVRAAAEVSPAAERLLESSAAPIVLLPRHSPCHLAPELAPGNPLIGALLPYSPLHVLVLQAFGGPVVATSANLSEEPLCTDNDEAQHRLSGIADFLLVHDRPIARAVDDSVVRLSAEDAPILLRRARGYAPVPVRLPAVLREPLLCVGGQMKNTIAVASGNEIVLSPHLGDLGHAATQQLFERTISMLQQLYAVAPGVVVHDLHPDYDSTRWAAAHGLRRIAVQHHLAHLLACLLDNDAAANDVLGITWDGTGYGSDSTIWGGEFILLSDNRAERFARLRPFHLIGAESAVREPRRVAFALLEQLGKPNAAVQLGFDARQEDLMRRMLAQSLNSPVCSSAGRLFDGVAALLGLCAHNAFEGQAAMRLEAAATRAHHPRRALPFPIVPASDSSARREIDWRPAMAELARDPRDPAELARSFHRGLAQAMVKIARDAGAGTVALTGGCFQNALLLDLATSELTDAGFRVLAHRRLPPNDNSLAAGQAMAALLNLTNVSLPGDI